MIFIVNSEYRMLKNTLICLNIGTPKIINFPFWINGKLMILGVPILMYFRISVQEKKNSVFIDWVWRVVCDFMMVKICFSIA